MRIKKIDYNKSDGVVVYITEEERCNEDIKAELANLRNQYKEVAVFVSGKNNIEDVLTRMIQERR